jgi:protein phosphatase
MAEARLAFSSSHLGHVRPANEDRWCIGTLISDGVNGQWSGRLDSAAGWAMVADGMGGHAAGDVASRLALETLAASLSQARNEQSIALAIEQANRSLFEHMYAVPGRLRMGSTVVGILFSGAGAFAFNVGDSRLYSWRSGRLVQHSVDHTLGRLGARGRSHALTQSLGGTSARMPLDPFVERLALADDASLLLCSDGLTDMISDEEIAALLRSGPRHPAAALVEAALDAGGNDNVTVVVLGPANVRG